MSNLKLEPGSLTKKCDKKKSSNPNNIITFDFELGPLVSRWCTNSDASLPKSTVF